ncbi:ABC transporter substrate-binding protein [Aquabacter spiritensis]|uniref:NitT/TauT family transport system substrate-binding protein n=1 Tax=Aquabacter spiritensis TaxID=933073 RepID=A0A4R3M108_9HYPH|nr:ABC transporter substrate-binding protein [Aquabacter spiritensis]TCT06774.1 NitT/TauT family transport system substrate-binding protein [Aquabacter spiritensis]
MFRIAQRLGGALLVSAACFAPMASPAFAETSEIRIVKQYGLAFLPLMVMEREKLFEKRAAALGIDTKPVYMTLGNNTAANEALISGSVNVITNGPPGFLTVWSRTKGTPSEVKGIASLLSQSSWLNTRNPDVKTIKDFTEKDRIALSAVKISIPAIILQMAAAKEWGQSEYKKLDPLTVSLPHPDGMSALLSGKTEITAHFTSPPFQNIEVKTPGVHTVLTSEEVMGGPSTWSILFSTVKFKEENPKTMQAFVEGLADAQALINADKSKAADIYLSFAKEGGAKKEDIVALLSDPGTNYTMTPQKIMKYAEFLKTVGSLKVIPATWNEPFFEYVQTLPGD